MTIHLFTTSDYKSTRSSELARYVASVISQDISVDTLVVHLLLQNCSLEQSSETRNSLPSYFRVFNEPGVLSLSQARNRMLKDCMATHSLGSDDIVGFPDDDSWFPSGFAFNLSKVFEALPRLGLIICRNSLEPKSDAFDETDVRSARTAEIVRLASSNCMFVRGNILQAVGGFDPDLGLGTPAKGGEDTDFALRAFLSSEASGLIDRDLIGHRPSDQASVAKYYRGSLTVLARYATRTRPLMWEFRRKIMVGVYLVLNRRLSFLSYISCIKDIVWAL